MQTFDEAVEALASRPDVILLDLELSGERGDALLDPIIEHAALSTVFVLSAVQDIDRAVALMRRGADDFLSKPVTPTLLRRRVEHALVRRRLATRLHLGDGPDGTADDVSLRQLELNLSTPMQELCAAIRTVARTGMTVLIQGETGTGKELVARAIHGSSDRSDGPFVTVNCGALPRELMEAELFGHTTGAFTGAAGTREGLVLRAQGGSLFLDEIGELPLELQPKLLRFLQEGEIRAVGSDRTRKLDVRVIAATHQDLRKNADAGTFREDLYFRLSVLPIPVPALRQRQSDVPGLAEYFLREVAAHAGREFKGFERAALRALMAQPWPGNVRELQNRVRRASVYAPGPLLSVADLQLQGDEQPDGMTWPPELLQGSFGDARAEVVSDFERAYVSAALAAADGNVAEAARSAGLPRKSLWRIAQRVGLAADRASRKAGQLGSGALDGAPMKSVSADLDRLMAAERDGYLTRARETLGSLAELLVAPPQLDGWGEVRQTAHRLRGSGASYGFQAITDAAGELEDAANRLDLEACRGHLQALEAALGS